MITSTVMLDPDYHTAKNVNKQIFFPSRNIICEKILKCLYFMLCSGLGPTSKWIINKTRALSSSNQMTHQIKWEIKRNIISAHKSAVLSARSVHLIKRYIDSLGCPWPFINTNSETVSVRDKRRIAFYILSLQRNLICWYSSVHHCNAALSLVQ